ncbi:MerR family transcriptional regulator [Kineobactrum sediminis]|nr:MerR family transcriptional regulator [Kineobactrum sediminis]
MKEAIAMKEAVLESRPLYGIGTVARLTGLKPDTLRVWERRYGLGASYKSPTGRRQYTQSDLEHMQIIAALVNNGSRIGEIASTERKTLEMLLRGRGKNGRAAVPAAKPRVVFVGDQLCEWLDEHQGCLANVNALLVRTALADIGTDFYPQIGTADSLVVECTNLGGTQVRQLGDLMQALDVERAVVCYQFANERWLTALEEQNIAATTFPPDPAYLAYELARSIADKTRSAGDSNLGELMTAKPRQFNELQLRGARQLKNALDCECPRHIADLIRSLASFEDYSASCSVENWNEAAVHACVYAYAAQARWLMEKALQAVLEGHADEYQSVLRTITDSPVGDAA